MSVEAVGLDGSRTDDLRGAYVRAIGLWRGLGWFGGDRCGGFRRVHAVKGELSHYATTVTSKVPAAITAVPDSGTRCTLKPLAVLPSA